MLFAMFYYNYDIRSCSTICCTCMREYTHDNATLTGLAYNYIITACIFQPGTSLLTLIIIQQMLVIEI